MKKKKKVLFICTHNSARSQMAEALLASKGREKYRVFSAGTEPGGVHPLAVEVMKEVGIDISRAKSKSVSEFTGKSFDYIVTVCDSAKEACPFFPGGGKRIHKSFEDPASFSGSLKERLNKFRHIRNEIDSWINEKFL